MKLPDNLLNPSAKMLRQFAVGWLVFFLGLGAWQYLGQGPSMLAFWFCPVAVIGAALGWFAPPIFRWVFVVWMWLAFPFGWLISQMALAILFYGVITPVALLFRIRGRDRLRRFKPGNASSFWMAKETPADVRRYFRPY